MNPAPRPTRVTVNRTGNDVTVRIESGEEIQPRADGILARIRERVRGRSRFEGNGAGGDVGTGEKVNRAY